jgi:hypothetical protein
MLRRLLICLALVIGVIMYTHRWYNGMWWTDAWDYEWPGFYTYLWTAPGYFF